MALRFYRCGCSGQVYYAPRADGPAREDEAAPRLHTPLHLASPRPAGSGFRVLADLGEGRQALLCLGATRAEALGLARAGALPRGTTRLRLQRWVGGPGRGCWQDLACRQGELPRPRGERHGRRRAARPA